MWLGWINGILGLWLIVAAFVITESKTGNLINGITTGIVLLVLGIWAAMITNAGRAGSSPSSGPG